MGEQELEAVGENMKQLEISAEKAQEREEKLKDKIHQLMERLKHAEACYEYGESNITKLNHRIDDIEDEIYREKLKIKKVSDDCLHVVISILISFIPLSSLLLSHEKSFIKIQSRWFKDASLIKFLPFHSFYNQKSNLVSY